MAAADNGDSSARDGDLYDVGSAVTVVDVEAAGEATVEEFDESVFVPEVPAGVAGDAGQLGSGSSGLTPCDPPLSVPPGEAVDRMIQHLRPVPPRLMPFPWECDPVLRSIFEGPCGHDPLPRLEQFPMGSLVPVEASVPSDVAGSFSERLLRAKRLRTKPWCDVIEEDRQTSILAWVRLLEGQGQQNQLAEQLSRTSSLQDKMIVLQDVFAAKATSTLRVRALDLTKFVNWGKKVGADIDPVREEVAYAYCRHLIESKAAATSVKRFKEAIVFAKHLVNWNVDPEALSSRRIAGAALNSLSNLGPIKRSEPLPPGFLVYLGNLLTDDVSSVEEKYCASIFLFLVYTRSRFSDAQRIASEPKIERGHLVAEVKNYKTARAKGRRGLALPVCAPALGLRKLAWAEAFLDLRRTIGVEGGPAVPFFPTLVDNSPALGAVTLDDATAALRRMFLKAVEAGSCLWADVAKFATHSCKRTTLYWAALAGMDLDTRRLLGNHTVKADGSWLAYSVEAMRAPVNKIFAVYAKVDSGELFGEVEVADRPLVGEVEAVESSVGSLSSGTDTSGEGDKELAALVAGDQLAEEEVPDVEVELYRHSKYGTYHLRKKRDSTDQVRLVCGRLLSESFSPLAGWPSTVVPRCATCFSSSLASRLGL